MHFTAAVRTKSSLFNNHFCFLMIQKSLSFQLLVLPKLFIFCNEKCNSCVITPFLCSAFRLELGDSRVVTTPPTCRGPWPTCWAWSAWYEPATGAPSKSATQRTASPRAAQLGEPSTVAVFSFFSFSFSGFYHFQACRVSEHVRVWRRTPPRCTKTDASGPQRLRARPDVKLTNEERVRAFYWIAKLADGRMKTKRTGQVWSWWAVWADHRLLHLSPDQNQRNLSERFVHCTTIMQLYVFCC